MTLRAPATELYSLTSTPGSLTLDCAPIAASEKSTPAFVARRLQHHSFNCSTDMTFVPDSVGQAAGLLIFKDENHQYFFGRTLDAEGNDIIFVDMTTPEGTQTIGTAPAPAGESSITLRIHSDGLTYDFSCYDETSKKMTDIATGADARQTSTAAAGGFTGTTVGPYATSARKI